MRKFDLQPYEYIFLAGLLAYTADKFLIFVCFNDLDALHAQEPIDFFWSIKSPELKSEVAAHSIGTPAAGGLTSLAT